MRNCLLLAGLLLAPCCAAAPLPRFPPGAVWNQDISQAPLAADSANMLAALQGLGGWGNGNRLQIDFSMHVLHADAGAPRLPVAAGGYTPDCDSGFQFPLPAGGAVEGEDGYTCTGGGDCHLLVVQGHTLFEAYAASVAGGALQTQCALTWDLGRVYPRHGRGEQCTSTDAAGFPVAPLLFNADEVAAALAVDGDLGHAIRFILPNARMAAGVYVHPATHAGAPSGPASTLPYGTRLRLKAGFDMRAYSPPARVLLRTLQRYGMLLSDGGNIALTGESDRYTQVKWDDLGITSRVFVDGSPALQVNDFEVVETGPRIALTYACRRTPDDFVFIDGFGY
ncbi:hypothetical protein [Dokdonella sp.]|uniref:hypothetical protein n=1 Tax=Dokdonella sp. TaxID=2291710 RepID=UPI0031C60336|nr:hypothetical protein [Dokdonella sp.]